MPPQCVPGALADPQQASSFPGGNDGILRCIVKWLNPAAIEGSSQFADVHNGEVRSIRCVAFY